MDQAGAVLRSAFVALVGVGGAAGAAAGRFVVVIVGGWRVVDAAVVRRGIGRDRVVGRIRIMSMPICRAKTACTLVWASAQLFSQLLWGFLVIHGTTR